MIEEVEAPAKINLTLEILGKRADGYHELATVFQQVGLSDSLSFDWSGSGVLVFCDHPDAPPNENNLVVKAVRSAEAFLGRPVNVSIRLEKRIPVWAGLGGGSSNAAATLQILGKRFGIPRHEIFLMAAQLGADVPFFLTGCKTAIAGGKGENLEPLPPFPSHPVVIVKPPFSISTSFAYGKIRDYSEGEKSKGLAEALKSKNSNMLHYLVNDFEKALFSDYPILERIKKALLSAGALAAQLSGSGSALFAFARSMEDAQKLKEVVEPFGKTWVCKI